MEKQDETKETMHTQSTISLRPSGLLATDEGNVRYIARLHPHGGPEGLTPQDIADGERLALAWNCHDEMLAVLKDADRLLGYFHWDSSTGRTDKFEMVQRIREAIANAERKAQP